MSDKKSLPASYVKPEKVQMKSSSSSPLSTLAWIVGGVTLLGTLIVITLLLQTPIGTVVIGPLNRLFAADSVQVMWYITRSAGLTAYMVMWLSTAWGLAVSSKILDAMLHRSFTYDFHQFLSLLAIGFTVLHVGVLMADRYLPYSLAQILVPFLSPYRPVWVGIGVIALYLTLLVTVTFYIRGRIGMKAFRYIHMSSLLAYLGVTVHSLLSGTDSSLPSVLMMYTGTFLVIIFLTAYWLVILAQKKQKAISAPAVSPARAVPPPTKARYYR
jgi:sulfoxide reductase heme-binding subunit YedZ